MRVFSALTKPATGVAFSPDGALLAVGGAGNVVHLVNVTTGQCVQTHALQGWYAGSRVHLGFSPDGRRLYAANINLHAITPATGEYQPLGFAGYSRLAVDPRGQDLWAASDGNIGRWDVHTLAARPAVPRLPNPSNHTTWPGVAVSACGGWAAVSRKTWAPGANRDAAFVLDATTLAIRFAAEWKGHEAKWMSFHPTAPLLAAACGPVLRVWNLDAQAEFAAIKAGKLHFMSAAFSPCGRYLAAVSKDRTARLWPINAWDQPKTYDWDIGKLLDLAFSPDGTVCAVASDSGKILLFDVD